SRVKLFFSLIFSDSLADYVVPVGLSPRFALTHRGSVDAHYRELKKSRNPFFAFFFRLLSFPANLT
ncbi:hypothetical protein, partial [Providencia burhodogranariea]